MTLQEAVDRFIANASFVLEEHRLRRLCYDEITGEFFYEVA